jgi:hypothetical protein
VRQELLTLPEHMSSPPGFSGVHTARSFVFCVMFCRSLFVLFLLASDYSFGIIKFFLQCIKLIYWFWKRGTVDEQHV